MSGQFSRWKKKIRFLVWLVALLLPLATAPQGTAVSTHTPVHTSGGAQTGLSSPVRTSQVDQPTPITPDGFDPQNYFADKTIELIVGVSPGGGYDIFSRLLAQHGAKYFPPSTKFLVKNYPGGGQLRGHRVLWTAKPDGLSIGPVHPRWFFAAAIKQEVPNFDLNSAVFVGSPTFGISRTGNYICADASRIRSWSDVLATGQPLTVGELAPGDGTSAGAALLELLGGPIKMVYGYGGSAEVMAAFNRREVMAIAYCNETLVPRLFPDWMKAKRLVPLFWWAAPPDPEWLKKLGFKGEVPNLFDLPGVKISEDDKAAFDVMVQITASTRTYMLPNGTPSHIKQFWVSLFRKLLKDPAFIKAATAAGYGDVLSYGSGDDIQAAIKQAYGLNQPQLKLLQKLGPKQ